MQFEHIQRARKDSQGEIREAVPQTDTGGLVLVYQGEREKKSQGTRQKSWT
jgi:hypothetical protein